MTDESLLVLPEPVLFDGACSCFLLTSGVLQQCSALQKSKLVMNLTKVHIFLLGFITFRVFRDDKYSDKLRFCTCFPRFNSTHIQIRKDLASSRKCKKTKKPKTRILANFQLHDSIMRQGSSKPNHPPSWVLGCITVNQVPPCWPGQITEGVLCSVLFGTFKCGDWKIYYLNFGKENTWGRKRCLQRCVCAQLLSHVWLVANLWPVACQAPLSIGQRYWSELTFLSLGIFLTRESDPRLLPVMVGWQEDSLPSCKALLQVMVGWQVDSLPSCKALLPVMVGWQVDSLPLLQSPPTGDGGLAGFATLLQSPPTDDGGLAGGFATLLQSPQVPEVLSHWWKIVFSVWVLGKVGNSKEIYLGSIKRRPF